MRVQGRAQRQVALGPNAARELTGRARSMRTANAERQKSAACSAQTSRLRARKLRLSRERDALGVVLTRAMILMQTLKLATYHGNMTERLSVHTQSSAAAWSVSPSSSGNAAPRAPARP